MRHLPRLSPAETELLGAVSNSDGLAWCTAAFPSIQFVKNDIAPPLHAIYAVSVFTHLPTKQQKAWADELERLLADDGVLIFTINGDNAARLPLPHEHACYKTVRDQVKEGNAMISRVQTDGIMSAQDRSRAWQPLRTNLDIAVHLAQSKMSGDYPAKRRAAAMRSQTPSERRVLRRSCTAQPSHPIVPRTERFISMYHYVRAERACLLS
jgi:hypothetical protein